MVAEQSAWYGANLPEFLQAQNTILPFYYESTGVETFFRDERDPSPRSRRLFAFHRPETLGAWLDEADTLRARLAAMPAAHPLSTLGMRGCQTDAIKHLEGAREVRALAVDFAKAADTWKESQEFLMKEFSLR